MQFQTTEHCSKLGEACAGFWDVRKKPMCTHFKVYIVPPSFCCIRICVLCTWSNIAIEKKKSWVPKKKKKPCCLLGPNDVRQCGSFRKGSVWMVRMFTLCKMWISLVALERAHRMQKLVVYVCSYFLHWSPFLEPYIMCCAHLIYTSVVKTHKFHATGRKKQPAVSTSFYSAPRRATYRPQKTCSTCLKACWGALLYCLINLFGQTYSVKSMF